MPREGQLSNCATERKEQWRLELLATAHPAGKGPFKTPQSWWLAALA